GLTFAHNGWTLPPDLAGTKQAAIHVPAAVTLNGAEDIVLRGCTIEHLSTYGVAMHDETIEGVLDHCTLRDLGAGGVRIWNGCRRNAVLDCEIADAGVIYACAVGVLIGQSSGNRVEHCHIHDMYYTGVSVGWNWGYAESHGYGNLIEWNHIHDIGRGVLSDMGGIYLLGHAPGTRLRFNHIHDITCRRYGGWCIYTDEGSTDVLIESNLAYNANRTAFNQHYGRNNRIRNNILAYGSDAVLSYGKPEPHLGLIFERNIFLSHDTPMLKSVSPDRWTPRQTRFDGNLYWCQTGPVRFQGAAALYATQVFPDGFPAARNRLAELPDLPIVEGEPEEGDWARAATVERFVSRHGDAVAPAGAAQVRMLRRGDELLIRGVFARPRQYETPDAPLWGREHVELFLRPRPDRPPVAQFGLASDGETAAVWHDAEAEPQLDWTGEARDEGERWTALLRIPLGQVASVGDDGSPPRWGFLLGFCRPAEVADLEAWQAMGHDPSGRAADPRFVDPAGGDFRLPSDSPAFEAGFQPFDLSDVGPRPAPGAGLRQTPTTRESP
ncbi:MAG: right-handed parallel beta-helix repeat-containing protein, partial [Planctomycetota bacterium]